MPILYEGNIKFIMKPFLNRPHHNRSAISPSNPNTYLIQKQKVNLKTVLKNRQNHKLHKIVSNVITNRSVSYQRETGIEDYSGEKQGNRDSQFMDRRLRNSKSLDLSNFNLLPEVHQRSRSAMRSFNQLSNVQPEVDRHQPSYEQVTAKLQQLDSQAEQLIRKKLAKMSTKQSIITLKSKGKDQISEQIQKLIAKIKGLKSENFQNAKMSQAQVKSLMDRKINLLEKLLAETETESEVLKKYFFAISAINQQKKSQMLLKKGISMNDPPGRRINLRVGKSYDITKSQQPSAVCNKSSNQLEYHSPKANQYETYRHKHQQFTANPQPFPRSSYNRQFLINPKIINFSCKNMDNHTSFGKSRFNSSTYSKDFQRVKTQIVDFRELDSYRNKIKNIQVSYNFRNRKEEVEHGMEKSRKFLEEQLKQRYNAKTVKLTQSPTKTDSASNLLSTQSHRNFTGQPQPEPPKIKNRQLTNLKYSYKTLINN